MSLQQSKSLVAIALLLIVFACTPEKVPAGENVGDDAPQTSQPTPDAPEGNLVGTVTDSVTGEPIGGVPVTDGHTYAVTDMNGNYTLKGDTLSRTVYLSVPAEYEIPTDKDHHPAFYINGDFTDTTKLYRNDFKLTPRETVNNRFILVNAADIHIYDDEDLKKFAQRSLPDMIESIEAYSDDSFRECVAVLNGDQLSDRMEMLEPFKQTIAGKSVAGRKLVFLHCIGNHDFDAEYINKTGLKADSYHASRTFVENFGPVDYSVNIGNAHIVVMNNLMVKGTGTTRYGQALCVEYDEGFTDSQLKWLEADLALVPNPAEKVVILCVHATVMNKTNRNYQAVARLLTRFNEGYIISGHTHRIRNVNLKHTCAGGSSVREYNIQMMGGMWWNSNLSVDGSPAGFSLMKFSGKRLYDSVNKATCADFSYQLRVYDGNDSYDGYTAGSGVSEPKYNTTFSWPEACKGRFVARVWNADADNWTVEFVKDGVAVPMTRLSGDKRLADECTYSFAYNIHKNIYGNESTYHTAADDIWVIDAPGGDPSAVTGWKIVATHKASAAKTHVYETCVLQRDYTGFAYGDSFPAYN